jgi:hypothetical protein
MKMKHRCLLFAGISTVAYLGQKIWLQFAEPQLAVPYALAQLESGMDGWRKLSAWQAAHQLPTFAAEGLVVLAALGCFGRPVWMLGRTVLAWISGRFKAPAKSLAVPLAAAVLALSGSGCMKPYDRPEHVEIDTSETGFLIPLEGEGGAQTKFESVDYLQQRKVAMKRVSITHRWNQTGRMPNEGHWMPAVRLVKVNRSPVTREWTAEQKHAHGGDKAIWIESADSVGFSMGFTCTAFIDEKDAATFLYWYPSGSLASVMDAEVRGRIQQASAEVAAKYALDVLRTKKQEIADAVREDVTSFFLKRGITVTTVGMFGGMTYENPAIQKAIDETVIAQQLKVVSAAKFEAQQKENERIELEATATAERFRLEAKGRSDAKLAEAKAEAEARTAQAKAEADAIRSINEATAASTPMLLQIRALEVEKARVEKWGGQFPQMMLGSNPNVLFTSPLAPFAPVSPQK